MDIPREFAEMLGRLGLGKAAEALGATEPEVSVRLNAAKGAEIAVAGAEPVPWEPQGFYLPERPAFTFDPALHGGMYYVQDASSMIVGEVVRRLVGGLGRPVLYADACAAPGGKTTAAMAALPEGSFVLANEYEPARALALADNLARWGFPAYAVSRGEAQRLAGLKGMFDIVAADVPCSGEGMMRKNATAATQWSAGLVAQCAALQRDIVEAAWQALRPGGWFVYSTCTFNRTENEENVEWMVSNLGAEPMDLGLAGFPGVMGGIDTDLPCARFVPGYARGEGLFVAVLRKPGELGGNVACPPSKGRAKPIAGVSKWLEEGYVAVADKRGDIYAMPAQYEGLSRVLGEQLNLLVPGVPVATLKGRDYVPAQALALAPEVRAGGAFAQAEVDYATAIAFLSGEAMRLDGDVPRGFVEICHAGVPLGYVKNIGTRANNLLTRGVRIRSQHVPDEAPVIVRRKLP